MISRPCPYSLSKSNDFKQIINTFNIGLSLDKIEKILSNKNNQIPSYIFCENCKAVLSGKLVKIPNSQKTQCKFCNESVQLSKSDLNQISYMNEEKAYYHDVKKEEKKAKSSTTVLIVICLDYSGSMNMSYIPGENSFGNQFLKKKKIPIEFKDFMTEYSEISRKELLLINLERQLNILFDSNSNYNYQVFMITFSSEIIMYGNGSKQNFNITLDSKYFDKMPECMKFGRNSAFKLFDKNKDSNIAYLFETLQDKEADGVTSLGPAIACGLGVIEAIKPELCQFYIFTDGVANNGIGDMNNILEAKKLYGELADIGLKSGVIFHVIGFEDENSKLSILQELIERNADSKLERIATPVLKVKNGQKTYTYDEPNLTKILHEALKVSASTYGILTKLKIYSINSADINFCKDSELNVKKKNRKKAKIIYKLIGNISEELNNVCCKYDILNEDELFYLQIQLKFTKPINGEKNFIVINQSSEIKKALNYEEINLKCCNSILINDSFEKNENFYGPYLNMMYQCKYRGYNETFKQAEDNLKNYIFNLYKANKKKNEKIFSKVEKKAIEMIENEEKMKKADGEAMKKNHIDDIKNIEHIKIQDDDESDNDEQTMKVRRLKKNVQKENAEDNEDQTLKNKRIIEKKIEGIKQDDKFKKKDREEAKEEENEDEEEEEKTLKPKKLLGKKKIKTKIKIFFNY